MYTADSVCSTFLLPSLYAGGEHERYDRPPYYSAKGHVTRFLGLPRATCKKYLYAASVKVLFSVVVAAVVSIPILLLVILLEVHCYFMVFYLFLFYLLFCYCHYWTVRESVFSS